MRIVRFAHGESTAYGVLENTQVSVVDGSPFGTLALTGQRYPLGEVRLLAPVVPTKILGVGRNFAAGGESAEPSGDPLVFSKPPSSVVGDGAAIVLPACAGQVDFEGELAVVIGDQARHVSRERAYDVVFGYTITNDISAREYQRSDGQWTRAKGFDTFCPLGPWIETELDPADLLVRTLVDGEVRQKGSTARLIHDIPRLIEWLSAVMTLEPGDVILTGTPEGTGPLAAGQTVTVAIEGLGKLVNPVENAKE
ncbi:fumarylacetoacetate hydrolase family protein [Amycolatopsis sp. NPDC059657]|uniref:fumarylacetoacetate hydrolase family protein n=1 Tax=Amycolatopsis sp. NPDC059657 TaxID=3346899 RepID=UPI0036717A46